MDAAESKFHDAETDLTVLIDDVVRATAKAQSAIAKVLGKPPADEAASPPPKTSIAA
ncbi:hypothetical protein [Rhodoplanes roseus]|uniref:hypothetical protein n=1 Tax=Rhodoplanes roseus TaxID=29409 RepID=UPI0014748F54|nr:hypothetical protein [Rhodoplanes roseus]